MQHHPGSWYIPWGVPLQKMMSVPFNPAAAAAGYHQPQITAASVQQATQQQQHQQHQHQQQQLQQQQQQHQQQQPHQQQNYSHHQLQALHHNLTNTAVAMNPMQHQQMHPAAAAAMFTPLTLRSFVGHPHLNLGQQPIPGAAQQPQQTMTNQTHSQLTSLNLNNIGVMPVRQNTASTNNTGLIMPMRKVIFNFI